MAVQATKFKTEFFWTDVEQAQERLIGSIVLYDGKPHMVENVRHGQEDGVPRLDIRPCASNNTASRKKADSTKFSRFRELPNIGWMNSVGNGCVFIKRRSVTTRTHGLSNTNTVVSRFQAPPGSNDRVLMAGGGIGILSVCYDDAFTDMHEGRYPSLDGILTNIKPNTAIAYSRLFCVFHDSNGLKWLYREDKRIGLFNRSALYLLEKYAFLREEIMADKAFTLDNIREL